MFVSRWKSLFQLLKYKLICMNNYNLTISNVLQINEFIVNKNIYNYDLKKFLKCKLMRDSVMKSAFELYHPSLLLTSICTFNVINRFQGHFHPHKLDSCTLG